MLPVTDATMGAVEYALRGLSVRSDVRSNNVANLNTPGFRAGRVDFEGALRAALNTESPENAPGPAVVPDATFPDSQGNSVNLENEIVGMMKDNLLRDAMVNAYNFKSGVLRTAIQGR